MLLRLALTLQALRGALTKKLLGPHVFAVIATSDSGHFAVDPEDGVVGGQMRMKGQYAQAEMQRLRRYIQARSNVLVVGAHVGTLTIPISKLCKEVVAIEPNPRTYQLLTFNIALNSASNCHAVNIAANDKEEQIPFLLSRANSGGSKRVPKTRWLYYYDNPEVISVQAASLDEYLDNKDFDLVVMDIEGSEYFALKGMQEILSKCKVLAVEFSPHHLRNVSCVTVRTFLSVIIPHFSKMTIPSKHIQVEATQFEKYLTEMYEQDIGDEGLLFEKT